MKRKRHNKTDDQKAILVWFYFHALRSGLSSWQVSELLGIPVATFYSWRRAYNNRLPFDSSRSFGYSWDKPIALRQFVKLLKQQRKEPK